MGAKACKNSKVRNVKRTEALDLEQDDQNGSEINEQQEAETIKFVAEDGDSEVLKSADSQNKESSSKESSDDEQQEQLQNSIREEEENAKQKAEEEKRKLEEEERKRLEEEERKRFEEEERKRLEEEARLKAELEREEAERKMKSLEEQREPTTISADQSNLENEAEVQPVECTSPSIVNEIKDDQLSQGTMSTQVTGAKHKTSISKGKLRETAQGATPRAYRHHRPCDMTAVDTTVGSISKTLGCDLNEDHDETVCYICKCIDLSDAPLLN